MDHHLRKVGFLFALGSTWVFFGSHGIAAPSSAAPTSSRATDNDGQGELRGISVEEGQKQLQSLADKIRKQNRALVVNAEGCSEYQLTLKPLASAHTSEKLAELAFSTYREDVSARDFENGAHNSRFSTVARASNSAIKIYHTYYHRVRDESFPREHKHPCADLVIQQALREFMEEHIFLPAFRFWHERDSNYHNQRRTSMLHNSKNSCVQLGRQPRYWSEKLESIVNQPQEFWFNALQGSKLHDIRVAVLHQFANVLMMHAEFEDIAKEFLDKKDIKKVEGDDKFLVYACIDNYLWNAEKQFNKMLYETSDAEFEDLYSYKLQHRLEPMKQLHRTYASEDALEKSHEILRNKGVHVPKDILDDLEDRAVRKAEREEDTLAQEVTDEDRDEL